MNVVPPAGAVRQRIALYRRLAQLQPVRSSYSRKFSLAAFVGLFTPLAAFILWLLLARADWQAMYPILAALFLASFTGFLWMLWAVRELLAPVDLTVEALRHYIESRKLPELPIDFPDEAGRLMEGTQYTLRQLDETIRRLERVSAIDELTGIYNRRAGEKRLAEEVARAERDLQSFQLALLDLRELRMINRSFGHAAGDACIAHVSDLLQLNTRRGDWIARWGADEFLVGLHRNRAPRLVIGRIVKAIEMNPCEIAPGNRLAIALTCGVAEYRFGSGVAGVLADVDTALAHGRREGANDSGSTVCFCADIRVEQRADAAPAPL